MKQIKRIFSILIVFVMILGFSTTAFAAEGDTKLTYETAAAELAEKYGVEINITVIDADAVSNLSEKDIINQINALEATLINGQQALKDNNEAAEAAWEEIVSSGRLMDTPSLSSDINTRANYTVYYYQNIGYIYPNASTIQCSVTGDRVYNNNHGCHLWGSLISSSSSLYFGSAADSWNQTNSSTVKIDGGRTYYAQYWGDLTETYNDGFHDVQITSQNWRIWFEAYCPA